MKRIGMLTSGGDCQSLNATMRGVVKGLNVLEGNVEIYGFIDGYKGLIYGNYKRLTSQDFSGILTTGGTILGTSRQPFKLMRTPDENGLDKVEAMKATYRYLDLDCLVILGGNGSQKTANLLREEGLNIVSLPKTIDNDLWGTDMTFGFQSAVDIATQTIDRIHTTAASHNRVFIVELMGHKVGWVTLHAGIAGGADIILIPEIPYDLRHVIEAIKRRNEQGKQFTILAVAEGAISKEDAQLSKKQYKAKLAKRKYSTVGYELASQIEKATGQEVRVTIPGHTQRGGSPVPFDRVISSRLGVAAAELIAKEDYGKLLIMKGYDVTTLPLEKTAGKLKYVSPDDQIVLQAKHLGISFGDKFKSSRCETWRVILVSVS
ncbi:MAG: 6-phosphofructokinase [Anaerobutyricum sp.]